ncbi:MAG: MBOAT family protein [Muribaculaceae bacterium]|nr:MBOAT family protein [Muribaculaceae bacterium]
MLFNSFEFLLFLPVVFLLHWKLCKSRQSRNILLIIASYVFYGWWNPVFLLLIFFTTVCSFYSGLLIRRYRENRSRALSALWTNVLINLVILGVFKYFNFFSQSFADAMTVVGWDVDAVTLDLILPVGVSFYTFQALSYSIDVYRKLTEPTKDFIAFTVFIAFFPQLVAGPIERSTNLLPQFLNTRTFDYKRAVEGMRLILWGLFKKMIVADNAAPVVDSIFGDYSYAGAQNLWMGAFLFTFQIYCDFSGYSDIAIGVARLFGVELMRNFRFPYFSKGMNDFWKRWHISLTSWFRDYVYIPLGGNRKGKVRTTANTFLVFLTSGLWHGANYTFIVWGAYHALLQLPHIFFRKQRAGEGVKAKTVPLYFRDTFLMGVTFLLVMTGWIIFRSDHLADAFHYIRLMFSAPVTEVVKAKTALSYCLIMLIAEWFSRNKETPFDFSGTGLTRFKTVRWTIYIVTFMFILLISGTAEQFIYFLF